MKRAKRKPDPQHVISRKILSRMLPPEPPADMRQGYLAVVKRLMMGDESAKVTAQQLRAEEFKRRREGRL